MFQSTSITLESIVTFVKHGDSHFVVHGHVAMTGDQVVHIISADNLDITSCAVLAKAKTGDHLGITFMEGVDGGEAFRRYASVALEKRQAMQSARMPVAPGVALPSGDALPVAASA